MVRQMEWDEASRFLLHGTRTAKVATVRADGSPHIVPVWFTLDAGEVVFSTFSRSVKARNMAGEPRVAIVVDDEIPPFGFVAIRGRARLIPRPDDFLFWATRVAQRYVGPARAAAVGESFVAIDDLLVRVSIDSVTAQADIVS